MSERDILNPVQGFDRTVNDSMNPNQGWQRTRKSTLAIAKPAFGSPSYRETSNSGHSYSLTYTRRNLAVTERLKQFHEQFEDGYFTLRDYDSDRDYVGHFVGDIPQSMERNGRFTSAGWTFEEVPGAPMLVYPDKWERWAVSHYPFRDDGSPRVAITQGAWIRPAAVVGDDGVARQPNQISNLAPVVGDSITFEYRGYGFRIWAAMGPEYNGFQLFVDGVIVGTEPLADTQDDGPQMVCTMTNLPLDIHRVQIVLNSGGIILDHFEVMR